MSAWKNEGLNFTERAAAECTFRSLPVSLSGTVLRKICNQLAPGMRPMEPYDSNVMRVFNLTSTTFVDELSDSSHQNLYNNLAAFQVHSSLVFQRHHASTPPLCMCVCVCRHRDDSLNKHRQMDFWRDFWEKHKNFYIHKACVESNRCTWRTISRLW